MESNSKSEQFVIDLFSHVATSNYFSGDKDLIVALQPYKDKDRPSVNVFTYDIGRAVARFAEEDVHSGKTFLDCFLKEHPSSDGDQLEKEFGAALRGFPKKYLSSRYDCKNFFEYCGLMQNIFLSCCYSREMALIPVLVESMVKELHLAFCDLPDCENYQEYAENFMKGLRKG